MNTFVQSLVIILCLGTVFIIVHTPLQAYIAPILGILILFSVIYFIIKKRSVKDQELFQGSYSEFAAITLGILLIIFLTEGFHSSLFFLVYFLLFGISFMFHPLTVFVFMFGLIAIFAEQALQGDIFVNMIRLGSLVLLSPIAYFFGNEFRRREKLEKEVKEKAEKIIKNAQELSLKPENKEEILSDIIETSEKLKDDAENN